MRESQVLKFLINLLFLAALLQSSSAFSLLAPNQLKSLQEAGNSDLGSKLIDKIKGVYKVRFKNQLIDGSKFTSEDILKIKRASKSEFYFTLDLNFYNGHTCSMRGLAKYRKNGTFIFVDTKNNTANYQCLLQFTVTSKGIKTFDITNQCREMYCGARGGLNTDEFTFKQAS